MAVCPFADQSKRYDRKYPGSYVGGPYRGVLHSTETTGLPSYKSGSVAPHFTVNPRTGKIWQHYDTGRPSRALLHVGSVQTNNRGPIQIEIIGYSDVAAAKKTGGLRVDQMTAAEMAPVMKLMRWVEATCHVDRACHVTFKPYPASAGEGNDVRLSATGWMTYRAWCAHQNVPQNEHGDASDIDIHALLALPSPTPAPDPTTEDEVTAFASLSTGPKAGAVYVTNFQTRRWVPGPAYKAKQIEAGVPGKVWEFETEAGLTAFAGALIGPDYDPEATK